MIVAFMNMKGGVGKTTLCVHLAGIAAYRRLRVLLIDYDPQYNATQHLIEPRKYFELEEANKTVYSVLQPDHAAAVPFEVRIAGEEVQAPRPSNIAIQLFTFGQSPGKKGTVHLVPGSPKLMYLALGRVEKTTKPLEDRFHEFLAIAEGEYDFVFIDCHPAGSFLTKSALTMADFVLTPIVPDPYSQRGLFLMLEFLEHLSKISNKTTQMRIVFNRVPTRGADQKLEDSIRSQAELGPLCLATTIHSRECIANAGKVAGASWARMIQWSKKPWSSQAKAELSRVLDELIEETQGGESTSA